jgi:inosine-uridine nucleoside N-ribohydrolase
MPSILLVVTALCATCIDSSSTPRPVIISTDPGIDDSIALLLAIASPQINLRAVCIDFGSLSNTSQLAQNALAVLSLGGAAHVPVYMGAALPLSAPFHDLGGPLFHGKDGLGGVRRPPTQGSINTTISAPEAIVEACREWKVKPILISLAPLTNIALALGLEPQLAKLCPDLYIMGGTMAVAGNVSPLAEANIANDAEAAARVFSAGFNLRVAGLDVTMSTWLSEDYLQSLRLLPGPVGEFVYNMTQFYTQVCYVYLGKCILLSRCAQFMSRCICYLDILLMRLISVIDGLQTTCCCRHTGQ